MSFKITHGKYSIGTVGALYVVIMNGDGGTNDTEIEHQMDKTRHSSFNNNNTRRAVLDW